MNGIGEVFRDRIALADETFQQFDGKRNKIQLIEQTIQAIGNLGIVQTFQ